MCVCEYFKTVCYEIPVLFLQLYQSDHLFARVIYFDPYDWFF